MFSDLQKRIDLFAILSFFIPIFIYLLTLAPSITFYDSGEFITAVSCLGSTHSPGYPLFVNFAKPFTWIPFGNVAFRVNFATAVSGAAACFVVYLLTSYFLKSEKLFEDDKYNSILIKVAALSAALTFAFSSRLWLQSNHDKPYPLVALIVGVIFYLVLRWRESYKAGDEKPAYIFIGAFLAGIATGAHQTIVLMLPAYAFLILVTVIPEWRAILKIREWPALFRIRDFIIALFFGLLGFTINLHLPIRATRHPLLNWGDTETLTQFLWHFLRKGYIDEHPVRTWHILWQQLNAFNIPNEFTFVGLVLFLLGMMIFFVKRRIEIAAYFVALISFLLVIVGYFNTPVETIFLSEEFFTPIYLLSAVFIGLGLFGIFKWIVSINRGFIEQLPLVLIGMLLFLSFPAAVCALHYKENNQLWNYIAFDYSGNSLKSAPQNAILYTWGDSGAFPLWYIQGIERMREDMDIIHTPHLVFAWYIDAFPKVFPKNSIVRNPAFNDEPPEAILYAAIAEQIQSRPVLIDYSTRYSVSFENYAIEQRGIIYRLFPNYSNKQVFMPPDLSVWDLYVLREVMGERRVFADLDTQKAIGIYGRALMETGQALVFLGRVTEGKYFIQNAVTIAPDLNDYAESILRQTK
ncbi:MAG: DUF2723 domain-containing protein [Desulfuromonadales bacterium]|nr:DUF2723 domain-containing protein [Desulfuromonadales bacterium]